LSEKGSSISNKKPIVCGSSSTLYKSTIHNSPQQLTTTTAAVLFGSMGNTNILRLLLLMLSQQCGVRSVNPTGGWIKILFLAVRVSYNYIKLLSSCSSEQGGEIFCIHKMKI
jgi:hypothetical protein